MYMSRENYYGAENLERFSRKVCYVFDFTKMVEGRDVILRPRLCEKTQSGEGLFGVDLIVKGKNGEKVSATYFQLCTARKGGCRRDCEQYNHYVNSVKEEVIAEGRTVRLMQNEAQAKCQHRL